MALYENEISRFAVTKGMFDIAGVQWGHAKRAWESRDIPGAILTGTLAAGETVVFAIATPGAVLFDLTVTRAVRAEIAEENKQSQAENPEDDVI